MYIINSRSFFGHLVEILGPVDFLPPLFMLMVEKMANRVVRQNPEAQNSVALLISVLRRHPPALQTFVSPISLNYNDLKLK
jgi:U3 small nucleolar RNA-associated protein 10